MVGTAVPAFKPSMHSAGFSSRERKVVVTFTHHRGVDAESKPTICNIRIQEEAPAPFFPCIQKRLSCGLLLLPPISLLPHAAHIDALSWSCKEGGAHLPMVMV
jgi:hypothetical protein